MLSGSQLHAFLRSIDGIVQTDLVCRQCGSLGYTLTSQSQTFCCFCDGYVDQDGMNVVHANSQNEKNLSGMSSAAVKGDWMDGVQFADALAATKDPFFLYGAGMFYNFFSDFTYNDVDYGLSGFMYPNAEKRSDELANNKYNAMALLSKSKEYMFKALKILSAGHQDSKMLYLKFIANSKLKRFPHAATALVDIDSNPNNSIYSQYANLIFSIDTAVKLPEPGKLPAIAQASGSPNFYYYLAKFLVKNKDLESASAILTKLTQKVYMPMAFYYNKRIIDVMKASGFDQ